MLKLIVSAVLVGLVWSSPFELTEKYIEDFKHGLDALAKEGKETVYKEGSIEGLELHEEEAIKNAEKFDFIVVGGGASGAVVATRLSEVPEWSVLLLEAGEPETPFTLVPAMFNHLATSTYNWGYHAEPQKTACLGMEKEICTLTSGKALGGSTSINNLLYSRGNAKDYDLWADNGNDEWCYKDVLPYFKKIEDAQLHNFDRKYHSQGGPLHVEEPQHVTEMKEVFLHAGKELGLEQVDYNGKSQIGISVPQVNTRHGKRDSTSQAYLIPNKARKNLHVRPLSQVTQILISPHTKEATGVKYLHNGKLFVVKAEKETIISAGAIGSPKLLMLSGIGPKEHLEHLHIDVVADLHVGKNLKDHVVFPGVSFYANETHHETDHDNLIKLLKERTGPLTNAGPEAIAYIKTPASKDKSTDFPDVELLFDSNVYNNGHESLKYLHYKPEIYDSLWKPTEGKKLISVIPYLMHPKSTGSVSLKSKDPLNWPVVNMNLFTDVDDHDLATLVHAAKKSVEFGNTEAFKKVGAHLNEHPVHGCETHEFNSDLYWKCAVRHLSTPGYHYTGTCRMGPATDKEAVVDNRLRVHEIHKLRVADASVVPVTITGHTSGAAMLVGEKASDLIKHDWHHEI